MNTSLFIARRIRHAPIATFSATVTKVGIASIAIGLSVIIVAFSVLFGFKSTIQQKIFLFGSHIQVSKFSLNNSYEETPLPAHTKLYDEAKQIKGLRHIQAVAMKAGILQTTDELSGAVLKGVGKDYDWQQFKETLVEGKVPEVQPDSGYSTQILISRQMATQLQLAVGGDVLMYFIDNPPRARKLQVTGIYETGLPEFDKTMVIGDIRMIQRLNNWGADSVGSYEIFVNNFQQLDAVYKRVREAASPDMRPVRVTDNYRPLFEWLMLLDNNTAVFLTLILFVAGFNMVSILFVLMMERTPMIGLFKALGSSNALIRGVFFYVGLNMVIKGLLIGNAVGIGLCLIQDKFRVIPLDPKNYYMNYVPIEWSIPVIVLANVASLALIGLILWLPTIVITRIQPVKALVFKK
ncbi:ABC transporter permease [Tellurirhabdus bombi]|uniref:ABC transporter permease n=1 Tax=Tellurirhabdus bombi TaxID=2907205 RepID=UPI001F29E30D|nr:FtsX-like permease family protein [Tellurirhabdus bombi]